MYDVSIVVALTSEIMINCKQILTIGLNGLENVKEELVLKLN